MIIHQDQSPEGIWFAMRVTYRRELNVKQLLDEQGIESFIPMRYEIYVKNRHKERRLVPVVRNLIFVHTTPTIIKCVKSKIPHLQYLMKIDGMKKVPIIVPGKQMKQFITVAGSYEEQLVYLKPEEFNAGIRKGTKVRIHGGVFDGMEGLFCKVKGVRDRRVVISVQDVIAVTTATIHPDLLEIIS